jgi:3-hydroxybutyryl-CoA dehydratase
MIATQKPAQLNVGAELRAAPRQMTRERMRRYIDTHETVAIDDGRIHQGPPTIHDDDAFARANGLPGIIADGMVSTNWILGLLLDIFGRDFAERGRLRTKYIKPIYEDQTVISCARVTAIDTAADGTRTYSLEVWCETEAQVVLTVGEARAYVPNR